MRLFQKVRSLFSIPEDNSDLLRSQAIAFSRQVPLLYFIVMINTAALASAHFFTAPHVLTVWLPLALYVLCVFRLRKWWELRDRPMTVERSVTMLRGTLRFAALLGIGFTAWSLSLLPHGNPYAQSFVPFYMAVTGISIILCLMHVRAAAIIIALAIMPPFAFVFGTSGNPVFFLMTVSGLCVIGGLMYMVHVNSRDFGNLIATQKALVDKQTEMQELLDENFRLANIDSLTGLPNRRSFFAALDRLRANGQGARTCFAVGLIDLDGFKPVNDLYGHATGDKILVEVGRRLIAQSSPGIFISRIGGDEFGVIMHGYVDPEIIRAFGDKLCDVLTGPYVVHDLTVQISGTAGYAVAMQDEEPAENLVERADCALYHAKANARGHAVMFDTSHEAQMRQRSSIEQALRNADFEREISLVFQPIFDLRTGRPCGVEALARWESPVLGAVSPAVFIPVAERTGLVSQLSEHLLRKAMLAVQLLPDPCYISFNLSACDVVSPQAISRLADIVKRSNIAPQRIEFEVTETALMHDFEQACMSLTQLRALGTRIALDDFGAGYSSLSYVHKLPLDKIKVDRSFVVDLETNATSAGIVKTVIDLCRNLGMDCLVEGTETAAQLAILTRLGVHLYQGYYFSRPLPLEDVLDYMAAFDGETAARA